MGEEAIYVNVVSNVRVKKYDVRSVVCGCLATPRLPAVVDMQPKETIRPDGQNRFVRPGVERRRAASLAVGAFSSRY